MCQYYVGENQNGKQCNSTIKKIIKVFDTNLCLRIEINKCNYDKIKFNIDRICDYFKLTPQDIDLIIDYKLISEENKNLKIDLLCQLIPYINSWHSFTVLRDRKSVV